MSKILLVDDEPRYRELMSQLLIERGYEVESAASGTEAVSMASKFVPDILIVDWMLKNRLNGLDTSEAIVRINPKLQTILITGYPSLKLKERVRTLTRTQFLAKPFRRQELLDAIAESAGQLRADVAEPGAEK